MLQRSLDETSPTCSMIELLFEPPVGTLFGKEEMDAIERVLMSGETLSRGKDVQAFEQEFATFCEAPHAVAVSSGTAALRIAAQLLRIQEGDEVIVPVTSFWNTIVPFVECKAVMRVADVDGYTLAADPAHVESLITSKTKAILVLSLGGDPCNMDPLITIARKHGVALVEDAAHSVGATYDGKRIGSFADISCFSFASLKNMSTLGEGGMLVTTHQKYADEAAKLRESWPIGTQEKRASTSFGPYTKPADASFMRAGDAFDVDWKSLEVVGTNYKMTSVAAAVGRVQLAKVMRFNDMRRALASEYDAALQRIPGIRLRDRYPDTISSQHLYNVFVTPESGINRNQLVQELKNRHDISFIHRFWPIHLHGVLRMQGHALGEAPVYEKLWFTEMLSLPIAPSMTNESVQWLTQKIAETCAILD